MKRIPRHLIYVLVMLATPLVPASAQETTKAASEKAWTPFFTSFREAVKKRKKVALKEMMAPDFFYTIGHHASDQREAAFAYWDEQNSRGWKAFNRILAKGVVRTTHRGFSNTGQLEGPMRIAPPAAAKRRNLRNDLIDWYAVFLFKGGRWYCITFVECCD